MTSVEPIPETFLAKLLKEFGIQWTHLIILSGVVFSSFHLQHYLNPGIWMLGTVGAFSIVYLFRSRISHDFLKVAIWSALAVTVFLLAPLLVLIHRDIEILAFMKRWPEGATLYLSMAIGIPLGIGVISYRKQDEFMRAPLPDALANAVKSITLHNDFVYEKARYDIEFELRPTKSKDVVMRFTATLNVLNRSKTSVQYEGLFDPAGREKKIHYATINKKRMNESDPERRTERGFHLKHDAASGESFEIIVSGESTFYGRDSEIVATYRPCNHFTLCIKKPPRELNVNVQQMLPRKVEPTESPVGDLVLEYVDGVLPYQGVRIFWQRQNATA